MDFSQEEILKKYISLYKQFVASYEPDFEVAEGTTRYVRFNDAWRFLNPYDKFLTSRLTNKKNTYPKVPSAKIPKNADPRNYVTLRYDAAGELRWSKTGSDDGDGMVIVYVSKQLTIGYFVRSSQGKVTSHSVAFLEWYEYDDAGRLIAAEEYRGKGIFEEGITINCEYYEYDGDVLSRAWRFDKYESHPMPMVMDLVLRMVPDRIVNPERFCYTFRRVLDGLDYTLEQFYRKSQTITHEGHVPEETLEHLAANGIRLV
ncbi:MAG: hypothetical protein IK125_00445 [Lachnospiraceae bacterium]|nr:hypothetical protein [Lachnospiraceae bacterium]